MFQFFSLFLKVAREGACLRSSSSSFQSLGPRKDIAFCSFLVFRSGSERSTMSMRRGQSGGDRHVFQFFSLLLKVAREGACLRSSSSSFQSLGPRKDIAFCPFLVFRSGSERSTMSIRRGQTSPIRRGQYGDALKELR